jgi:hypothetical protein
MTGVDEPDRAHIAKAVSAVFASMFGVQEHLDTVFPLIKLEPIGRPFFVRDAFSEPNP